MLLDDLSALIDEIEQKIEEVDRAPVMVIIGQKQLDIIRVSDILCRTPSATFDIPLFIFRFFDGIKVMPMPKLEMTVPTSCFVGPSRYKISVNIRELENGSRANKDY